MSDGGKWHGDVRCEITKILKELGHQVYSECMRKDNGELIDSENNVLGKIRKIKLIISLYIETNEVSRPDLVIIENDHVKYIIEVEEKMNPKKMSGIIIATRNSNNCIIHGCGIKEKIFSVNNAKLFIVGKNKFIPPHIEVLFNDINLKKVLNLSEIKYVDYGTFIDFIHNL